MGRCRFSAQGTQIFDARFVGANSSYGAFRFPWSAQPATSPAVSAAQTGPGTTTVYECWNGATTVASWRVLAGPDPSALTAVATAPRRDFAMAVPVATTQPYIAVQALDAARHPLATSKATAVKARAALFGGTAFVSTTGMAGVFLGCFGSEACTGAMTITAGSTLLGERTRETISAGDGRNCAHRPDERGAVPAGPRTRRRSPRPRHRG